MFGKAACDQCHAKMNIRTPHRHTIAAVLNLLTLKRRPVCRRVIRESEFSPNRDGALPMPVKYDFLLPTPGGVRRISPGELAAGTQRQCSSLCMRFNLPTSIFQTSVDGQLLHSFTCSGRLSQSLKRANAEAVGKDAELRSQPSLESCMRR